MRGGRLASVRAHRLHKRYNGVSAGVGQISTGCRPRKHGGTTARRHAGRDQPLRRLSRPGVRRTPPLIMFGGAQLCFIPGRGTSAPPLGAAKPHQIRAESDGEPEARRAAACIGRDGRRRGTEAVVRCDGGEPADVVARGVDPRGGPTLGFSLVGGHLSLGFLYFCIKGFLSRRRITRATREREREERTRGLMIRSPPGRGHPSEGGAGLRNFPQEISDRTDKTPRAFCRLVRSPLLPLSFFSRPHAPLDTKHLPCRLSVRCPHGARPRSTG